MTVAVLFPAESVFQALHSYVPEECIACQEFGFFRDNHGGFFLLGAMQEKYRSHLLFFEECFETCFWNVSRNLIKLGLDYTEEITSG